MSRVELATCIDLSEGAAPSRVDRAAGVIRGVKLLGWRSENGRTYDPAGVEPRLYEGRVVNFNHHRGSGDRSVYDRFGRVVNVRKERDGLYGDLEYLRSHPYAESVAEAAERMPNVYGLSHTARGQERRAASGPATIERVESVQSVDLVGDPATVAGLYESRGGRLMATLKELKESLKATRPGYSRALHEMAEAGILGPDTAMDSPPDMAAPPDEAADHKRAILDACKACLDDGALGEDEKIKKIKKLLAIHKGDEAGDGDDEEGGGEGDGYTAGDDDTPAEESVKVDRKQLATALEENKKNKARIQAMESRERLRAAADEAGVKLSKELLESVRPDLTEPQAKALVAAQAKAVKENAARPRSAVGLPNGKVVRESKGEAAEDPKAIAKRIMGRG